jgi:hypothetical protein
MSGSDVVSESVVDEGMTIPENPDDGIERAIREKLDKKRRHADRIIRWYRNERKLGTDEKTLKTTFVDNLDNILDDLKTYEKYAEIFRQSDMVGKRVEVGTEDGKKVRVDPLKDFDRIRRFDGARRVISAMGDELYSKSEIPTGNEKYKLDENDRKDIRLLAFTTNVMCWATRGYETTNKFVYHLW